MDIKKDNEAQQDWKEDRFIDVVCGPLSSREAMSLAHYLVEAVEEIRLGAPSRIMIVGKDDQEIEKIGVQQILTHGEWCQNQYVDLDVLPDTPLPDSEGEQQE